MDLVPTTPEDVAPLLARCADFFALCEQEGSVRELFEEKPPGPCTKEVLAVRQQDALVGVVDLLSGYPTPDACFIGLVLLDPKARGQGLGEQVEAALVERALGSGAWKIQLAVHVANPEARRFWTRCGYRTLRKAVIRGSTTAEPRCWLMQKSLTWPQVKRTLR